MIEFFVDVGIALLVLFGTAIVLVGVGTVILNIMRKWP